MEMWMVVGEVREKGLDGGTAVMLLGELGCVGWWRRRLADASLDGDL